MRDGERNWGWRRIGVLDSERIASGLHSNMIKPAAPYAVNEFLEEHPRWQRQDEKLVRSYQAKTARIALSRLAAIGDLAEAANHHPAITWTYDRLLIQLTTHDVPGASALTSRDIVLAQDIEKVLK